LHLQGYCSFVVGCPEGFATVRLIKLHPRSGFGSSNSGLGAFDQFYHFAHPIAKDSIIARFD